MKLNVNGVTYDIENWDEFRDQLLNSIGFQITSEIVKEIDQLNLVDTGSFKGSINSDIINGELLIWSDAPHAPFLEYGTAGTVKGVTDPFGESTRGPNPTRKMPLIKKGDSFELLPSLKKWADKHGFDDKSAFLLARYIQKYGMEPKAPFRRVLYNENKMSRIIENSVRFASK